MQWMAKAVYHCLQNVRVLRTKILGMLILIPDEHSHIGCLEFKSMFGDAGTLSLASRFRTELKTAVASQS